MFSPFLAWTLVVGVEQNGRITWVRKPYATSEECVDGLLFIYTHPPKPGFRITEALCEKDFNLT